METSRDDVGIAIRSAFLNKTSKQRFSLFALVIVSIILIFVDNINFKPLNYFRSFIKDTVYRTSMAVEYPNEGLRSFTKFISNHINLHDNYQELKEENYKLRSQISKSDFLELENTQLRKLIDEQVISSSNFLSARVMLDKKSPYNDSFIINVGSNKGIKNGLAVLDGENFIGRIVDTNFFSSRILLISDLNSKIPVIIEPNGEHALLSGHGKDNPTLEYLPKNHKVINGNKIYTSGKEGIFSPGIPVGITKKEKNHFEVSLFSNLEQVTFVNVVLPKIKDEQ
tara:strand:- start:168 stop:1016 length:849 start_codon:yes stop_codon:yes gene_type:complete